MDDDLEGIGRELRDWLEEGRVLERQALISGPPSGLEPTAPVRLWREGEFYCAILRNHLGFLCGYVQVPEGHPWWGAYGDERVAGVPSLDDETLAVEGFENFGVLTTFIVMAGDSLDEFRETLDAMVSVHGGLTFAGPMLIEGAPWGWWLGFDCAHSGDAPDPEYVPIPWPNGGHVWTPDEVALEVSRIVTAVAATVGVRL
jgi:hypothetical protein